MALESEVDFGDEKAARSEAFNVELCFINPSRKTNISGGLEG